MDCTECTIQRPTHGQEEFYSGKKKAHCVKYQILVGIQFGSILKVNGPFEGKVHVL